jgi:hypothetical protein
MAGEAPSRGVVPTAGLGTYAGLFLVTLSTLMLEIALTRIFSVTMWYHFAFVAISVGLFGTTAGALIVHLLPSRFEEADVKRHLSTWALRFGVAVAACFAIQLAIPFTPRMTVGGIASVVATCLVVSVPFVCSGVVVCLALTRFPQRVNRLYACDLVGAGLGCVLFVGLLSWFDGPSLVVLIAAIAAVGSSAFALDAGRRRGIALAGLAAMVLGGFAVVNTVLHQDGRPLLRIIWAKETRDPDHDYERWNAFSRLTVDGDVDDPETASASLVIDSTAGTTLVRYRDGDDSDFLRGVIQNLPHYIRSDADVFVVGVGGGYDILSALEFDQRSVTGVEINADIIDIAHHKLGDFTGHLDRDPRVDIVVDEARSYLARTDRRYDLIQISLIDTWAATGAGAFALTENSLYTTEAWDLFLDRLRPNGLVTVTRFYQTVDANGRSVDPVETWRTVALAAQVLTDRGVAEPRDHLAIYRVPAGSYDVDLATVIVGRDPLSVGDRLELDEQAERLEFGTVLTGDVSTDPMLAAIAAPGGPGDAVDDVSADISPPTDNRPFFFQMADLDTLRDGDIGRDDLVTRPVMVLGALAVTVIGLAASCVMLPLLLAHRRPTTREAGRQARPFYTYFAGIGLGFLLIEIAQLQRLSIFLGHPTYGLSVVLFSVLVFSGFGSMLTERVVRFDRRRSLVAPLVVLLGLLGALGWATSVVIRTMAGATTPARIATAVAVLAPAALLMGMPFTIGMRAAALRPGTPTAFLWGINGAASVCASVLGVVIALFFGISTAFWAGTGAYMFALVSLLVITARAPVEARRIELDDEPGPPVPATTRPSPALPRGRTT